MIFIVKFSFIIPVYNIENYLRKCIDSILMQSFDNYEIILINDGSSDSSGEVCDEYKLISEKIKVIHKKNGGLSSARNIGIKYSTGEYLIFLDGDDYWIIDTLHNICDYIEKYNLDLLCFNYNLYNCNTSKISEKACINFKGLEEKILTGEEYLYKVLKVEELYEWYAWCYVIKKNIIISNNLYFKEGIKYEDIELVYKIILRCNRVGVFPYSILNYVINRKESITNIIKLSTEIDKINVIKDNIEYVKKHLNHNRNLQKMLCNNFSCTFYTSIIFLYCIKNKIDREVLYNYLKDNIYLCSYTISKKQKFIYSLIKIFGIRIVAKCLYFRKKLKDKV